MKISILREDLLRGVTRVQAIADRRGTLPILANALLHAEDGQLSLSATDLEVALSCTQPSTVEVPGTITLGAKKLFEIVREIDQNPVEISIEESSRVRIQAGSAAFSLLAISHQDYPSLPAPDGIELAALDTDLLAGLIDSTVYATSTDETPYNLTGLYLEHRREPQSLSFVACDRHRLAMTERAVPENFPLFDPGIIVPRKGIAEIRKLCDEIEGDVELGIVDGHLLLQAPGILLSCRLIDGEFPNYRQIIPTQTNARVTIDRQRLLQAVRRVALVASDRAGGLSFSLEDHCLTLSASNPDLGEAEEKVPLDYSGTPYSTRFDARYLSDALGAIRSKEVHIDLVDELSPAQLRPTDDEAQLAIIAPMRL